MDVGGDLCLSALSRGLAIDSTGDMFTFYVSLCFVFFFSSRRRHTRFDCDWSSDVCSSDLVQLSAVCVQGTSGVRRAEPSWLPARLRARELAEPRVTGTLVYVPIRCHVCDALPSVRRTHGLGTRSTRRPPDTRRCPRSTTGQVAVGRVSRC